MSLQDTMRLIGKMFKEGHTNTASKMAEAFIPQVCERLDHLEAELARYEIDREMYD
jgi:hypothetical protein